MNEHLRLFITSMLSFTVIISGVITVVSLIAWFFYNVEDALRIVYFSLPLFVITVLMLIRRKGGLMNLLYWNL